jgi:hypothetical protein
MRDEQDPSELRIGGVEGREPGLAEPGRHHDEAGAITFLARTPERLERLLLDEVRFGRWQRKLDGFVGGGAPARVGGSPANPITSDPVCVEKTR